VRSLASAAPHLDPAIVEIVDRALLIKKEARWASARAMRLAVQEVLARLRQRKGSSTTSRGNVEVPSAFQSVYGSSQDRGELSHSNSSSQGQADVSVLRLPFGLGPRSWILVLLLATLLVAVATWLAASWALAPPGTTSRQSTTPSEAITLTGT
jgi:hypothetical protein